ncbi:putative SKP1/BTB/POZ domain superfamily protein [Septoria linicola]|nr:putative SKP1/BTB/POZ domain superfamily protein [Septoria linicola]
MADTEGEVIIEDETAVDEEMGENVETVVDDSAPGGLEDIEPTIPSQTTFLDYLRSPIVELIVGSGDNQSTLFAHQALLVSSPFFAEACAQFSDNAGRRRIELQQDDEAATASVLEYLYKSDYFPALQGSTNLEYDPTTPSPDTDGVALLRHARIYTLAQKFGLSQLAALAHKKIHLTQSTAKGEIAYARFVYKETSVDDESIRKPVAAFWATRSHVLRHEAEHEFKRMCLEFPQFGFDVLSLVLDAQERRSQRAESGSTGGPGGRKRQRTVL